MKFDECFSEVREFSGRTLVIDGRLSKEKAQQMIERHYGETVEKAEIKAERVRFGFPPEGVEDREDFDGPIWYTGAGGVGSKPVWIFRIYDHLRRIKGFVPKE